MPTISKAIVDQHCRQNAMNLLDIESNANFTRTTNQSFKTIITDDNGVERLVEVRFIVGAIHEDKTAAELLKEEVTAFEEKKAAATKRLEDRRIKAEKDKAKREAAKAKKEESDNE